MKDSEKMIAEKINATPSGNDKKYAYDLGVEYFPLGDKKVRYHAVFSPSFVNPATGSRYSPYSIAIGMTINTTIVK